MKDNYLVVRKDGKLANIDDDGNFSWDPQGQTFSKEDATVLTKVHDDCYAFKVTPPKKRVKVTEDESAVLFNITTTTERPAAAIAAYVDEAGYKNKANIGALADLETHLMRAYENGWEIEKPKLYHVPVPYTKHSFYAKSSGTELTTVDESRLGEVRTKFTDEEITQYYLDGLGRKPV